MNEMKRSILLDEIQAKLDYLVDSDIANKRCTEDWYFLTAAQAAITGLKLTNNKNGISAVTASMSESE